MSGEEAHAHGSAAAVHRRDGLGMALAAIQAARRRQADKIRTFGLYRLVTW